MSAMFPSLTPRATDPLWFSVDRPADEEAELAREEAEHQAVGGVQNRAANYPSVLTIPEKAPTMAFSWLKAPTSAFTFKSLLRHYAKHGK